MTRPTITEAYARNRADAILHTPFGVLSAGEIDALARANAGHLAVKEFAP